jgi:hypothetical protein
VKPVRGNAPKQSIGHLSDGMKIRRFENLKMKMQADNKLLDILCRLPLGFGVSSVERRRIEDENDNPSAQE